MIFSRARRLGALLALMRAQGTHIRMVALAEGIALAVLLSAGAAAAASRDISIHRTAGISRYAKLWVLLYCPKGYKAIQGGHGKVPTGLRILSKGPETVKDRGHHTVIWAISVKNRSSRWLELRAWATCSKS